MCELYQSSTLDIFKLALPVKFILNLLKLLLKISTYFSERNHEGFRIPLATSIKEVYKKGYCCSQLPI